MNRNLYKQDSYRPTRKVQAGMYGGGAGVVLSWILAEILTAYQIDMPMEVQHASIGLITAAFSSISSYMTHSAYQE